MFAPTTPLRPPVPGSISVGSLRQAFAHKRLFDAVLTLEDPRAARKIQLRFHKPHPPSHLVLRFEDVDWEDLGVWTARPADVEAGLRFARDHAAGSLLIHCYHGIGRSGGMALAVLADRMGPGSEAAALERLLMIRPEACPNRIVIAHADALLGRNGALIAAVDVWEAATPAVQKFRAFRRSYAEKHPELYSPRPRTAD